MEEIPVQQYPKKRNAGIVNYLRTHNYAVQQSPKYFSLIQTKMEGQLIYMASLLAYHLGSHAQLRGGGNRQMWSHTAPDHRHHKARLEHQE
jgi:hypothetical protein